MTGGSDPAHVAEQAEAIAAAWSPPGCPSSWRLTAAQFAALRDDRELLAITADIPPDRLPALLFTAAATALVLELEPRPLRDCFPRVGEPQPPLGPDFAARYRAFCLDHRERLAELCATHRYQMNEVGRCADVLPALAPAIEEGREIVLIDIGTGAGLGLHLDRYGYRFRGPGDQVITRGDDDAPVVLDALPALLPSLPSESVVCLIDTYVNVFFTAGELERFRALLDRFGAERDLDWISVDPLVPLGEAADRTVVGLPASADLIERNRRQGVFGVIGRVRYRAGRRSRSLLGLAHPSAAWLQWMAGDAATEG